MEDGMHTRGTERRKELSKGNVIRATQIRGEEMHRGGFRHHLADSTQYSKGKLCTQENWRLCFHSEREQ